MLLKYSCYGLLVRINSSLIEPYLFMSITNCTISGYGFQQQVECTIASVPRTRMPLVTAAQKNLSFSTNTMQQN